MGSRCLAGFGCSRLTSRRRARHAGFGHQLQRNPTASTAVPIRVRYPAHPRIGVAIVEQCHHFRKKQILVGTHQRSKPQFHSLRAFGCVSGNQHRFPKGWCLLLNPP